MLRFAFNTKNWLLAAMLLITTTAFAGAPYPHISEGKGEECVAPEDVMRKDHMKFILHQRDETMHEGIRTEKYSLKKCINCHVVKDANQQPVTYKDSKHFCVSCHQYASVKIDCFQCHSSVPETDQPAHSSLDNSQATSGLSPH